MTNYEKIKAMSVEEMAKFIFMRIHTCEKCPASKLCEENIQELCVVLMEKWILQEAEE